ncbi:MAG: cytochrome c oxidase subunit, partial [Actinomycetota bacterium]|nr:cytochrome c oxidase subunit [Actinomycetota bacterium]
TGGCGANVRWGGREIVRKKVLWALGLLALALLVASCAPHATQDTLKPAGPTAQTEKNLFVPVFWIAVAVFVLVEGGILFISLKWRHRKGQDRLPTQTHGNTRLEIMWTIAPALILAVVMVPTIGTIWDLAKPPPANALNITVEGHQWWWGFVYTDPDMKTTYPPTPTAPVTNGPIHTGDVMVIPTGRPVYLSLASEGGALNGGVSGTNPDFEVIHSFWVPELAGKQDVVPGRTNHILLQADHPGTYYGQCAEFCGLQHGKMKFRVVALSQSDWTAWVANEKLPGATPTDPLAKEGMNTFTTGSCVACHSVGGTTAAGTAGPNLTHFAAPSHSCFAGCDWDTTDINALKAWLRDPNAVKLGSKMPNYHLTEDQINQLVAYLESLK